MRFKGKNIFQLFQLEKFEYQILKRYFNSQNCPRIFNGDKRSKLQMWFVDWLQYLFLHEMIKIGFLLFLELNNRNLSRSRWYFLLLFHFFSIQLYFVKTCLFLRDLLCFDGNQSIQHLNKLSVNFKFQHKTFFMKTDIIFGQQEVFTWW